MVSVRLLKFRLIWFRPHLTDPKTVSVVEKYWTEDFLFHFWHFREVLQIWMSSLCPCTDALQHKIAWQAGQKLQLSWFNQDPRIEKEVSADWDRVVGFHVKINNIQNNVYYILRHLRHWYSNSECVFLTCAVVLQVRRRLDLLWHQHEHHWIWFERVPHPVHLLCHWSAGQADGLLLTPSHRTKDLPSWNAAGHRNLHCHKHLSFKRL